MKTLATLIALGLGLSACVSPYGSRMAPVAGIGVVISEPRMPIRGHNRCQTAKWQRYAECRDYRPMPGPHMGY